MSKSQHPEDTGLKVFWAPAGQIIDPEYLDDDYPDINAIAREFEAHWMQSRQRKEE